MRYPAEQTAERHERLIEVASALFRERGIDAVSVGEVMRAAGMTHGAFYSHFESKEALATAAIEAAMERAGRVLDEALVDPGSAQRAYLARYLGPAHRDQAGSGCPVAALAIEIGRRGTDRSVLSGYVGLLIDRIATGFRWRRRGHGRDQAIATVAAMVGAVILARAVDDARLSDEILAATLRELTQA